MALEATIVKTGNTSDEPLLVIHGGAGKRIFEEPPEILAEADACLERALAAGMAKLQAGESALEAVVAAVHVMEDDPVFNAGRGAALTSDGTAELDAAVMLGDGSIGAVAGTKTVRNPIDAARAVMEQTPHVLIADPTHEELSSWGIEEVDPSYFITQRRIDSLERVQALPDGGWTKPGHGTVGAVARDASGTLAAATSTGGVTNQLPGRVGDTPLCGAGTYANRETVAVSCTGTGERFVEEVAAHEVHARVMWAHEMPAEAAKDVLENIEDRGGDGGIIVVPATGEGVVGYIAGCQMSYGYAYGDVRVTHP